MGLCGKFWVINQQAAGQINDRAFKSGPNLFLQKAIPCAVRNHRFTDWRFGGQHGQAFRDLGDRAFQKQAVDPVGVFNRIGQALAGFQIKRQRAGAEMHIQIKQRGR